MASIAKLVVTLGANTASFETDMKRANRNQARRMKQMKQDAEKMAKGLALAFTATAGAMTAIVKRTTDTADSMAKLGQRLGASTEALSEMGYVAEKSGVDFRTLEMGLQRMTRRIGEVAFLGKGEAKEALKVLGLEARKLADLPLDKQFEAIAEELSKVGNVSQRTSLAMKIFDAEGVRLVQLMGEGAEGIATMREEMRKTGAVISTDLAKTAERFNNNLALMNQYTKGVGVQLTTGLLPGLVDVQEYFLKNASATDRFASAGEWLADVIKRLIAAFIVMKGIATALGKVLVGVAMAIYNTFKGLFLAVKRPIDQLAAALSALRRGELKAAADALGDIPEAMADGFKEGAKEAVNAIKFIGTGLEDVQDSIDDAFDLLNFRAEESAESINEVVVTAQRMPDAFNQAEWALEEVVVTARRMENVIVPATKDVADAADDAADGFNAMSTAMDEGVRIMERAFSQVWSDLIDGSENAFDSIMDGFKSLLANLVHQATTQKITLQFQQAFGPGGGGFSSLDWGEIGEGLAGAIGSILGSELGGGGTGATYGALLGSIAGASELGAAAAFITGLPALAGPLGIALGGILGGLLGGLFDSDRPPVLQVTGFDTSRQSGSDRDTRITTALGDVFVRSRRINAENIAEITAAIEEFDNSLAGLLDDSQLDAVARSLEVWGEKMKGNAINVEQLLNSRFAAVLDTFEQDIQDFVNRGADLEARFARLQVGAAAQKIIESSDLFNGRTVSEFLSVVEAFKTGSNTIGEAFEEVIGLLDQIFGAQSALRGYADTSAVEQFTSIMAEEGRSLAESVVAVQAAIGEAIAGFDGSPAQLQEIAQLALVAREGEIRLLRQIDSIQQGINANLDDLEAKIAGLTEAPQTAEDIFREANALIADLLAATDSTQIADIESQFTALINSLSREDQLALQTPLLNMIDGFRDTANAMLEGFRQNAEDNATQTQQLADLFLSEIGDPLDVLANSNQVVADELGNIDESIQELGPALTSAIRRGFSGVTLSPVIVVDQGGLVNE